MYTKDQLDLIKVGELARIAQGMGLKIPANPTSSTLITAILGAQELQTPAEQASMVNPVDPELAKLTGQLSGRKRRIILSASEGDEFGHEAVPVGLNGVVWQIPRNVEVEVPDEVVGVLRAAAPMRPQKRPDGGIDMIRSQRFPFTDLGLVA